MVRSGMLLSTMALALCACVAAPPADRRPLSNLTGDYLAAKFSAEVNAIDEAADAYARAVERAPDNALVADAFFFQLARGDIDAAIPYAERLVASGGEVDGLAGLTLAAAAIRSGDLARADALLSKKAPTPLGENLFLLSRVWLISEQKGVEAALEFVDNIKEPSFTGFNPTFSAILAEKASDLDRAQAGHEISVQAFGGPVGREAFGAFLERKGDAAAARKFYSELAQQGGAAARLAVGGLRRIERGEASRAYADVSAQQGVAMTLYLFAGNILEQSAGERQRAADAGFRVGAPRFHLPLALANLAVWLNGDFSDARALAGGIFAVYDEVELSRAVLEPISPASQHYESARLQVAGGLADREQVDAAIGVLEETLRRDSDAQDARLALAGYLAGADRHERAISVATDAIAALLPEEPKSAWRIYLTRGASLLEIDQWPQAEHDLERAVELAPENPTTLNYLGYSWAERGLNLKKAFELIEKAVSLDPGVGAYIDSLGWAHYQLGEYDKAVGHLEKAAALEPGDSTITDHLGDVYWRLERKREAKFQWERALQLDATPKLRAAIELKLKNGLPSAEPRNPQRP
jgi:tetratricopeptide (TPR) repeat protein